MLAATGSIRDHLRTLLGYCLVGFVNTVLPSLVFSGAYLIVPFPRPVVILIQTLPAVLGKLLLPHIFSRIPYWNPPLAIALGCVSSAFIIYVSPPNVTPLVRIIAVALASITSAGGDVLWLGMLRYYGKPGLVGWGIGTGVGGVACAVLPWVLTVHMGQFLRNGLGYAWYLVPLMLVSHYLVLPKPPTQDARANDLGSKEDIELGSEVSAGLLRSPAPKPSTQLERIQAGFDLGKRLIRPFILPLVLGFAGQSAVFPGFSRAMAVTSEFGTYATFVAAYGLAFQLGNLVARSSLLFVKLPRARSMLIVLGVGVCLLAFSAVAPILGEPTLVFSLVFGAGVAAGAIYVGTYAAAVEDKTHDSGADREFSLGTISVGEPVGLIIGGLAGVALESVLCGIELDGNERWCDTTR